ncbi:invasion associated locus B family protein [Phyllobacterium myrsinacearum]|uniref:Invasion protein IalB n=1 Tax=Phyllobacterium myrsinacearum TaxID=28101 RepID=A0A839EI89_9HYPH|nr:invasion associated locus B family protein [Phyllobacterium myrsinacearum]MBA8879711.1 invasion protein IalB [Phyllobacterium myrsinacearum]
MRMKHLIHGVAAGMLAATPLHAQTDTVKPTAAPSSLAETYDDWSVNCGVEEAGRRCVLVQQQMHKNGQRVLTLEFTPESETGLKGNLALPFGLYLDKGVSFRIDDNPAGKPSRFRTCTPAGCIVPLTFTEATTKILRKGKILNLGAFASDTEKDITFPVSLKGFEAALNRTIELLKQ